MKKLITLLSLFLAVNALASIPHNVCLEEFKKTGDSVAYEFCLDQSSGPQAYSLPMPLCREVCEHSLDFDLCYEQECQGPKALSTTDECEKYIGYPNNEYELCLERNGVVGEIF